MDERKERLMDAIKERVKPEVIQEENEALKAQYMEVKARAEYFEAMVKQLEFEKEKAYLQGRIDGLEFSIRCNGVSGDIAIKASCSEFPNS